jgi:hypothetical protein
MKYIKLFENFINEAKSLRVTIDADLWKLKKPIEVKSPSYDAEFRLFSHPITQDQTWGNINYGEPGLNLIVFQITKPDNSDKCWIKIGAAKGSSMPNDDNTGSILWSTYGDNVPATVEEMKADPKAVAKRAASTFVGAKRGFDMNYSIGTQQQKGIFKIANDLDKPILELIEFAIKNIK